MLKKFNPPGVTPHPFYSHGVLATGRDRTLYISGQVGVRADGSMGEGIAEQTAIAVENVKAVLAEAGMSLEDVVKLTIYMVDPADMDGFTSQGAALLSSPPAATTLLFVHALAAPPLRIEIEAIAMA